MNIVVSGGTKGIGRAIAERFAQEGWHVAVCSRKLADLEAMRDDFAAKYPDCTFVYAVADVSVLGQVHGFADTVKKAFKTVDVLVNNAGVFIPGQIHSEEAGALEIMMQTNLYSAYHLTRALIGGMIEQKAGHVFNICSTASMYAYPNGGSYSISKFALLGFSKVLREEMKEHGVRVTSLLPGATMTASWAGVDIAEERLMKAEDVADLLHSSYVLSQRTVVEEIVLRPLLGDIG